MQNEKERQKRQAVNVAMFKQNDRKQSVSKLNYSLNYKVPYISKEALDK